VKRINYYLEVLIAFNFLRLLEDYHDLYYILGDYLGVLVDQGGFHFQFENDHLQLIIGVYFNP